MKETIIRNRKLRRIAGSFFIAAVMIGVGTILCFAVPVLLKQFVLKPVRMKLFHDSPSGRLFQWTGSIILIIAGYAAYAFLFRKHIEIDLRAQNIPWTP